MLKILNEIILWLALLALIICITVQVSASSGEYPEETLPDQLKNNHIPVMYLTIDPAEFDKVNESKDHSYRSWTGSIKICVHEGYTGDYSTETLEDTQELELDYIRGRGKINTGSYWPTVMIPAF